MEKSSWNGKIGKTFAILLAVLLFTGFSAAWWDSEWQYRKPVTVENPTGNDITNFPANITVDTASLIGQGKLQSGCQDIRIVKGNPGTAVEYNVENCSTSSTKVFFPANISASSSSKYYLYYGNGQATSKEERVDSRIINGMGQMGNFSYWATNNFSQAPTGLDSFHDGKASDGTVQSSGGLVDDYTGYSGLSRAGSGDWDVSPVSGKPVLGMGEDASQLDGQNSGSTGYNTFLAYTGYSQGSGKGTLGVEAPSGVYAHAWMHTQFLSCGGSGVSGLQFYGTASERPAASTESPMMGWFQGDGQYGVSGDSLLTLVYNQTSSGDQNKDITRSSTVDPQDGKYVYPFAQANCIGGRDDALSQIDDFYWSDSSGNRITMSTSTGTEQTLVSAKTVHTYRNGEPRSFYQENDTVNITVTGSFKSTPEIGVIDSENNLLVNQIKLNQNANSYSYPYEVNGSTGWYDVGFQPIISEWLTTSQEDWNSGSFLNATGAGGNLSIEGGERSEADNITSDGSSWNQISTENSYSSPAVFASSNTENEAGGSHLAKIRNVDGTGFEVKFCDHGGTDGGCESHVEENVGWFMIDVNDLDSLQGVEAGKTTLGTSSDTSSEARSIGLDESFGSSAIVVAEQQTYNHPGESIVQVPSTSTTGFSMYLCDHAEGKRGSCESHSSEEVAWIAVDPSASLPEYMEAGVTSTISDSGWQQQSLTKFSEAPLVKATINSNNGRQEAKSGRVRNVTSSSAYIGYCEHDGGDTCDGHAGENVGWIALSEGRRGSYETGSFETMFGAGKRVYWHNLSVKASVPQNTDYNISFSVNKTGSWVEYENLSDVPSSEYLRYNITMEGNETETPEIRSVSIDYNGPRDFSKIRENVFYGGEKWRGNFTDDDGNRYTFRRRINVSEPDVSTRWFSPVKLDLDFNFRPDNESVRVVAWNGSRMLEIPSQLYNADMVNGQVRNASLVFLSTLEKDENRTYYVVSTKLEHRENYSGVKFSSDGEYRVENAYFNSSFNSTLGGLLTDVRDKVGTGLSLSGIEPMDRYPQFDVSEGLESDTKRARVDSTATIKVDRGPLRTEISVEGGMDGSSTYPYSVDCSIYAANPYMICEKNLTTKASEDWSSLYFNGLVFDDQRFKWASYDNGSSVETFSLTDGSDKEGISSIDWISFYNNKTGDGAASLLLNKSMATGTQEYNLQDGPSNDYFQYLPISGTASVTAGDSFYTETARMFYSGVNEWQKVNATYKELENPVQVEKGAQVTDDKDKPFYTSSGNISSDDSSDLTVFSRWEDDSFLNYAEINITGNGEKGSDTTLFYAERDIRSGTSFVNRSWVNQTLNASRINAGEVKANITVFDVAGKSNTSIIEFNVSDSTAPEFSALSTTPGSKQGLDPGKEINVTVNVTEYSSVSNVSLHYRNSTSNFSRMDMQNLSLNGFTAEYSQSFTPSSEGNYTYYVTANDSLGQRRNTSEKAVRVEWDYTWNFDANFSEGSGSFNENVSIGNLSLENTGDFNQTFSFSTDNFNQRTWVNGTQLPTEFEIGNKSEALFRVNATTRDASFSEGVDTFNLSISNSSATPASRYSSFDVITTTGGPFLYTVFTQYNQTVTQGDSGIVLAAETTNKGNETGENIRIKFELPSGWSFQNTSKSENFDLQVGTSETFRTEVQLSSNASTGTQKIWAEAYGDNESYNTSVEVEVQAPSQNNTIIKDSGGGGGGGGAPQNSGLTRKQKQKLFQTEETYSIVRGKNANFTLKVQNPFDSGSLENVKLEISGFLDQYLSVQPQQIEKIPVNSSKNFTIKIEAPDYFSRGEYQLNMTITGLNNQSRVVKSGNETIVVKDTTEMTEYRIVNLIVHEISREKAEESLNSSINLTEELEQRGLMQRNLNDTVQRIKEAIEAGNYQQARQLSQQIQQSYKNAVKARQTIENVTELIERAEYRGLDTPRTERTLKMAKAALQRGDYSLALQRAQEARSLYTIETQGKTNYINLVKRKWQQISLGLFIFAITGFTGLRKGKIKLMERKISRLENERESINESMEELQKQCFQEETISLDEYKAGMQQYREQLSENISREIDLESKKLYWQKMLRSEPALRKKRERLQEMIEKAQKDYFEKKRISKTMYETKTEKYRDESAHVEEEIAETEIQKRTGLKGKLNQITS